MEREEVKKKIAERFGEKVKIDQPSEKRIYVYVEKDSWVDLASFLFDDLDARFDTGVGIDDRGGVEVLMFFPFDKEHYFVTIKTYAEKPYPELDSISNVIPGAKWIEREIFEMFEVKFKGHPDLRPVLRSDTRPEDFYPHKRENKDDHEMSRIKNEGIDRFNEVTGKPPEGQNP